MTEKRREYIRGPLAGRNQTGDFADVACTYAMRHAHCELARIWHKEDERGRAKGVIAPDRELIVPNRSFA
jgi:hypothetical protein